MTITGLEPSCFQEACSKDVWMHNEWGDQFHWEDWPLGDCRTVEGKEVCGVQMSL